MAIQKRAQQFSVAAIWGKHIVDFGLIKMQQRRMLSCIMVPDKASKNTVPVCIVIGIARRELLVEEQGVP